MAMMVIIIIIIIMVYCHNYDNHSKVKSANF